MINSITGPDELSKLGNINLILFHSDNCHHCRQFQNDWHTVVSKIKSQRIHVKPLSVEQKHFHHLDELGMYNDIQGVPSLVILDKKGKYIKKYQGPDRNPDNIIAWLKTHTPKLSELTSKLDGKKRKKRSKGKSTKGRSIRRTGTRRAKGKNRKLRLTLKKKGTKLKNYIILE